MASTLKDAPSYENPLFYVRKPAQVSALAYLSCVRTLVEATTFDTGRVVPAGSIGTIVLTHDDGAAYEVEFDASRGVATYSAKDLAAL